MSNLDTALTQAALMMPASLMSMPNPTKPKTRFQVAKRVFQLAASGGFPYTGQTYKQWAKKWLPSDSFRLMEIDINAAASPHLPKNPERVAFRVLCSTDSMDPIVVDLNKQKVGKSHLGFIPEVIVVDGKHRKQGMMLQGHSRVLAWVGCRALKRIKNATVVKDMKFRQVPLITNPGAKPAIEASAMSYVRGQKEMKFRGPLASTVALNCAVVPSSGQMIVDQSGGERGSRPRGAVVKAKKKMKSMGSGTSGGASGSMGVGSGFNPSIKSKAKIIEECDACGPAFSQGQLDDASTDDPSATDYEGDVPSASDQGTFVEASDRRQYHPKPNIKAPGAKGWSGLSPSPAKNAPGAGVGPRLPRSTGATRSEMSRLADTVPTIKSAKERFAERLNSKAKLIDKIYVKDKSKKHLFPNLNKRG